MLACPYMHIPPPHVKGSWMCLRFMHAHVSSLHFQSITKGITKLYRFFSKISPYFSMMYVTISWNFINFNKPGNSISAAKGRNNLRRMRNSLEHAFEKSSSVRRKLVFFIPFQNFFYKNSVKCIPNCR